MKNLLFALAFVLISSTTFSQVKVRPGIKMGINFSSLTNTAQASTKGGEYAGLFVNIHLAKFYELQVEAMYSNQGAKTNNYLSYIDGFDSTINNNFIEQDFNLQ